MVQRGQKQQQQQQGEAGKEQLGGQVEKEGTGRGWEWESLSLELWHGPGSEAGLQAETGVEAGAVMAGGAGSSVQVVGGCVGWHTDDDIGGGEGRGGGTVPGSVGVCGEGRVGSLGWEEEGAWTEGGLVSASPG